MITVLVIDDSATMLILLKKIIDKSDRMKCVGVAPNPVAAKELIRDLQPDVITLDVEMPKMNGLEFLDHMMRLKPVAVIMISTLTEAGSESALRALELGAIDFIAKPKADFADGMAMYEEEVLRKIETAGCAHVKRLTGDIPPVDIQAAAPAKTPLRPAGTQDRIVAIGAGVGGTEALKEILLRMPADCPPVLITQHMPEPLMRSLARRLDILCAARVKLAEDGEVVRRGAVYLAPGHADLRLQPAHDGYVCRLARESARPQAQSSIDQMFLALADAAGSRGTGVVLTGMGSDGAVGARAIMEQGGFNIAQNVETSVVYAMPEAVIAGAGINEVLPLEQIASRILMLEGALPN